MGQTSRTRPRRRSGRQGGGGRGLPGWAMLTIGLIIGLFVAFLVYLDDLEAPPNATAEAPPSDSSTAPADDTGEDESDGPRFEFYSILPELEVVVPDFGQESSGDGADAADETAESASAGGATVDEDGRYYLQAGSFRQADMADRLKAEITLLGLDVAVQDVRIEGEQWHRVRVGPYGADADLQAAQKRLRQHDIDYLVMREKSSG